MVLSSRERHLLFLSPFATRPDATAQHDPDHGKGRADDRRGVESVRPVAGRFAGLNPAGAGAGRYAGDIRPGAGIGLREGKASRRSIGIARKGSTRRQIGLPGIHETTACIADRLLGLLALMADFCSSQAPHRWSVLHIILRSNFRRESKSETFLRSPEFARTCRSEVPATLM